MSDEARNYHLARAADAENTEQVERPAPRHLNSSERIALIVIGKLAEQNYFSLEDIAGPDHDQHEILYWLFRDIADGIKSGLRVVDKVDLERLSEGDSE